MPKAFEVNTQQVNGTLVLKLMGDIDGSSASEIAVYLDRASGHYDRFVIDASAVKKLHPFGVAVLDKAITRLRRAGNDLRLADLLNIPKR
jgi:anti-anti-sigma factor